MIFSPKGLPAQNRPSRSPADPLPPLPEASRAAQSVALQRLCGTFVEERTAEFEKTEFCAASLPDEAGVGANRTSAVIDRRYSECPSARAAVAESAARCEPNELCATLLRS
jgi:hypothetical protein